MHSQDSVISSDAPPLNSSDSASTDSSSCTATHNKCVLEVIWRRLPTTLGSVSHCGELNERELTTQVPLMLSEGAHNIPSAVSSTCWHHVIVPPDVLDTALGMLCARQPSYVDMFQKYGSIESFKIVDLQLAVRPAAARHGCVQYCID